MILRMSLPPLQNGSFSKGCANWWKCWVACQSKEPCFAYAEVETDQELEWHGS
jgi:hypothetical protein